MIIWNINQYAEPPGGQFSNPVDIAINLTKRGHEITFFISSFNHYTLTETRFKSGTNDFTLQENHSGVRFIFLKTHPYKGNTAGRFFNMLSYGWNAVRAAKKTEERPDIVIASCPHLFGVLAGYIISRLKKSRFFFEIRDLWPQTLVDMGALPNRSPITFALRALERFLYNKAEKIITLVPFAYEYLLPLGIAREKIAYIPNGVSVQRYEKAAKEKPPNNPFTLMYIGGFARYNNIDLILDTAKILEQEKNVAFVLIGAGPEKPRLKRMAEEMNLKNVEFRDPIPKSEVPNAVKNASAFLYVIQDFQTLRYGVTPNKIFDYMASARPIIFSSPARNNPVEEARAGISVKPNNAEALSRAILELISTDVQVRENMGRNGLEYAKKFHDISVLADKLEHIF